MAPKKKDEKKKMAVTEAVMEDRFNTALLLDALKAPKEKLPRAQAALWLAGLCTQSDKKTEILAAPGIASVINAALIQGHPGEFGALVTLLRTLVSNSTADSSFAEVVLATPRLVSTLCTLMQSATNTAKHAAATVLLELAALPQLRPKLTKELIFPMVLQIIGDSATSAPVRDSMMLTLRAVVHHAVIEDAAAPERGGPPLLQQLAQVPSSLQAVMTYLRDGGARSDAALYVVFRMTVSPDQRLIFLEKGGLSLMAAALGDSKIGYEAKGFATSTLLLIIAKAEARSDALSALQLGPSPGQGATVVAVPGGQLMLQPSPAVLAAAAAERAAAMPQSRGGLVSRTGLKGSPVRGSSAKNGPPTASGPLRGGLERPLASRGPVSLHAEDAPPLVRELLSLSDHSTVLIRMGFVRLLLELLTPPSMRPDTAGSAGSGGRNAKAKAKARPKGGKKGGKQTVPKEELGTLRAATSCLRHLATLAAGITDMVAHPGGIMALHKWIGDSDPVVRRNSTAILTLLGVDIGALEALEQVGVPREYYNVLPNGKKRAPMMAGLGRESLLGGQGPTEEAPAAPSAAGDAHARAATESASEAGISGAAASAVAGEPPQPQAG